MTSLLSKPKPSFIAAALILLAMATTVLPSRAQQTIEDLSNVSLEQLANIKVYSASKHLQEMGDAPASVTIITADEIQKQGYRTLADILRTVRDLYPTSDRNYVYLGVRGFGLPEDYNAHVLMLIDGHRLNDNVYDQAMFGTEFPVDVDMIKQVEIVRGPSSSLYGSSAFFAIINVITRKGHDIDGWEVSFEPRSFDTYKGRVTYGGKIKGIELLASGSFYDSAGPTLYFPEFDFPATNHGITHNSSDRYRDLLLTASYRGFTFQAVGNSRDAAIPTATYGTAFDDPRTHNIDQHQYLDLGYKAALGATWELGLRAYYDRYGYDAWWGYNNDSYGDVVNRDLARGQRWGSELQLSRTFLRKHHLTFGTELRNNFQQDQLNFDIAPRAVYVDDRRSSWIAAGFVQDEYAITQRLTLNAGLRYDSYTRYGGSLNPRAALIFRPWSKTSLKLVYGSAFRAPNVYEAFYGTKTDTLALYALNPHLRPESMRNTELVWEQRLDHRFRISCDVFRASMDDLVTLVSDPATGLLMNVNANKARSTGVGFQIDGNLANGVEGTLSYSFTEAEDQRTNRTLANSPHHLGQFKLSVPLYRRRVFASLNGQYMSSRRTLAGNYIEGFPIFNATLFGHAINRHLDLSVALYNVFNQKYFDLGTPDARQDVFRQDGRTVGAKLTWSFGGNR